MNNKKQALLIIGSLRGSKSTSYYLGSMLTDMLIRKDFQVHELYINGIVDTGNSAGTLMSLVDAADILILSSPLYIDCAPYMVIRMMELISRNRIHNTSAKKQRFLVISNGGYPEAHHSNAAISIYRKFADEAGFYWIGGLSLGMGAALTVPIIRKIGFMIRGIKRSLDMSADAIAGDRPVPDAAINFMAKPFIPIWLYSFLGRSAARYFSITNGAWDIYKKPVVCS